MGANTIPLRSNGQTIDETWFNILRDVIKQDFVPRDSSAVAGDSAGKLGTNLYPWSKLFLGLAAEGISIETDGSGAILVKVAGTTVMKIGSYGIDKSSLPTGGRAISSSCGNFSTTNATYTDVTNLSATVTTTGGLVFVGLMHDDNILGNAASVITNNSSAGGAEGQLRILRDTSTTVLESALGSIAIGATSASSFIPSSIFWKFDTPAAGSHTYKVQVQRVTSSTTVSVNYSKLIVAELCG